MIDPTRYSIVARNYTFNFALWKGAGPRTVGQQTETFTRPGANGHGFQLTGTRGQPFEVTLVAYFPDFLTAQQRRIQYKNALGDIAFVKWEDIWFQSFQHAYFVMHVRTDRIKQVARASGIQYSYVFPTRLVSRWRLMPIWTV